MIKIKYRYINTIYDVIFVKIFYFFTCGDIF